MSNTPPDEVRSPAASVDGQLPAPAPAPARDADRTAPLRTAPPHAASSRTAPFRRAAAALAAVLALFGLGALGTVLGLYAQDQPVPPWLIAASLYVLPLAFLLMAGLVIDGIRRRRRG